MPQVLDLRRLAGVLEDAFGAAVRLDMPFVHVSLTTPAGSRYEWTNARGEHVGVFLPTTAYARPVEYPPIDSSDHAAAATFVIHGFDDVPEPADLLAIAEDLYVRTVAWALMLYGWPDPEQLSLPRAPWTLELILEQAMRSDVLH